MANPQKEDGYLKLANELAEALCKNCPGGTEGKIIWAVIRKTYGWNKKVDRISISQIVEATGKSRRMVIYALQNLEAKRMIFVVRAHSKGTYENEVSEISLNKNYDEWQPEAKGVQYQKNNARNKLHYHERNKLHHIAEPEEGGSAINVGSAINGKKVVQHVTNNVQFIAPTKDTKQKTITKDIYSAECQKINEQHNAVFKSKLTTTVPLVKNWQYWRTMYSLDDVFKAIEAAKKDEYWGQRMTPTILLRRKNPRGEDVDYIGEFRAQWKEPPPPEPWEAPPPPEKEVDPAQREKNLKALAALKDQLSGKLSMNKEKV